ncbi:AAA family ATPase [Streptomyces sp. NPDC052043]|uniref:AAA family ATPase n=1 Tax=Streptomyces sp. NPDC052043 TaxID=3365684 RepID=UPI0037D3D841
MNHRILGLTVRNFRTLTDVKLPLGSLTVLSGPNAAGKSNVLQSLEFLGDVAETGIEAALEKRGGFDVLAFRGGRSPVSRISVGVEGLWSDFASEDAPDRYELSISRPRLPEGSRKRYAMYRRERFVQHPTEGGQTSVELTSSAVKVDSDLPGDHTDETVDVGRMASALHQGPVPALPHTAPSARAVTDVKRHLSQIRVFDPDVREARKPHGISESRWQHLDSNASNLADFLRGLKQREDGEAWEMLLDDVRTVVPQIRDIHLVTPPDFASYQTAVELEEEGLRGRTRLTEASWGTVRILCMLAIFHDPSPPLLTCIEEVDHGIHPHALELLAERLREASERSQYLVTTHSPVFVNKLDADEWVPCGRRVSGASVIPDRMPGRIREVVKESEYEPLGDLWYSGSVGGSL